MKVVETAKPKPIERIMSIDPSSKSLAFAILEEGSLMARGKVKFDDRTQSGRIRVINAAIPLLLTKHKPDYLLIEHTIFIQSPQTTILMAIILGATMSQGLAQNVSTGSVGPLGWKRGLGYKNVSAPEKKQWALTMTPAEVKKKAEFERKERVRLIVAERIPGLEEMDHDIIDAIAIGIWGIENLEV